MQTYGGTNQVQRVTASPAERGGDDNGLTLEGQELDRSYVRTSGDVVVMTVADETQILAGILAQGLVSSKPPTA